MRALRGAGLSLERVPSLCHPAELFVFSLTRPTNPVKLWVALRGLTEEPFRDYGEVSEWFKEHAWKACIGGNLYRGFESRSLRQRRRGELFLVGAPSFWVFVPWFLAHVQNMCSGSGLVDEVGADEAHPLYDLLATLETLLHSYKSA